MDFAASASERQQFLPLVEWVEAEPLFVAKPAAPAARPALAAVSSPAWRSLSAGPRPIR
jgi:hypothetical protein